MTGIKGSFIGGPYDGLELDADEINERCLVIAATRADPLRLVLPPPRLWDSLAAGAMGSVATMPACSYLVMYEQVFTPRGVEYHVMTGGDDREGA